MLAREASLYIYFDLMTQLTDNCFNKRKIKFDKYFMDLVRIVGRKTTKRHFATAEYEALRNRFQLDQYNCSFRSNLIQGLAHTYETAFTNNLWMHAYNRVRNFIKKSNAENDKKILYQNMNYLFTTDKGQKTLQFPWKKGYFHDIRLNV
jgi:hypothetical protein